MPQTVSERDQMQSTAETIGLELKEALPMRRIDSLSIHDRNGDLIWLSEQTLGPDEHGAVLGAITVFEAEGNRAYVSEELGNARSAACFASTTPHGELVAVAMAIADSRTIDSLGPGKLITPKVRSLMQRLAILMKPPGKLVKPAAGSQKPQAPNAVEGSTISELAALSELEAASANLEAPSDLSASAIAKSPFAATGFGAASSGATPSGTAPSHAKRSAAIRPAAVVLPPSAGDASAGRSPSGNTIRIKAPAAVNSAPAALTSGVDNILRTESPTSGALEIALHVQQLMKLRSGGRTRRYEVLVRGRGDADSAGMNEQLARALNSRESAAAIDRAVTSELVSWLKQNPGIWNSDPASFSINLSLGSLLDVNFTGFVSQALQSSGVAPDTIGFEVPEKAFLKHREACAAFLEACEKIGCYVVIDDFSMHSDVVPFLASRALRVVKVDPQLTQSAMRDRLSQAMVIAISQASKVLGLHCVAKRIDSVATRQWLAAVGIDFAQGFAIENPRPLAALAEGKATKER